MNILLASPQHAFGINKDIGMDVLSPSLGLAYLNAVLKQNGHVTKVFDGRIYHNSLQELSLVLKKFNPAIVLISIHCTSEMEDGAMLAAQIKKINPKTITLVGGSHPSSLPQETLGEFPGIDIVMIGEGEVTLNELLIAIAQQQSLHSIKGIAFRKNRTVFLNSLRPYLEDINILPLPDFSDFALDKYKPHFFRGRELPIITSRGCPNSCVFCYQPMGNKVRRRSVESVVQEIKRNIQEYQVTQILFADDTLTIDPEYTIQLFETIVAKGLNTIRYIASTRIDRVTPAILAAMKKANVYVLTFGVESGNQELLNTIKKGFTLNQTEQAIRWTKEAGIKTDCNFIIGLPFESEKTIKQTIRFMLKINPDYVNFAILAPFPGTELWQWAEQGIGGLCLIEKSWAKTGRIVGNTLELKTISRRTLEYYQMLAYIKFYLRPSRIFCFFQKVNVFIIFKYLIHLAAGPSQKHLKSRKVL